MNTLPSRDQQRPAETSRDQQRPAETSRDQQRPAETIRPRKPLSRAVSSLLALLLFAVISACAGSGGGSDAPPPGGTSGAPPSTPTGLSARVVSSAQIDLSWNAVDGATGYKLYSGGVEIYRGTRLNYAHEGLNPSTTYSYSVMATNAKGDSPKSAVVNATTQPVSSSAPPTPTGLSAAVISHTQIDLSWDAVSAANSYQLFNGAKKIYEGTTDSYSHTGLSASTRYAYKVLAANAGGTSAPSTEIEATTSPAPIGIPGIPANLRAVAVSDTQIDLSWDAVAGATAYKLYSGAIRIYSGSNTAYNHRGLSADTEYGYTVAATNASGDSSPSAEVKATTKSLSALGGRPYPSLVPNLGNYVVRWNAVANATSYELYHANESFAGLDDVSTGYSGLDGGTQITLNGRTDTRHTFSNLDRSKKHYFVVVAKNSATNESSTSADLVYQSYPDYSAFYTQGRTMGYPGNDYSFAVLKSGTIHAWGSRNEGGGTPPTGSNYISITGNEQAFAALDDNGGIKSWGRDGRGGTGAPSDDAYVRITSNQRAFAALKFNGKISAWGDGNYGGSEAPSGSGYVGIYATYNAFAALKSDGRITAWGNSSYGGDGEPSDDGYVSITPATSAFAALKADGRITAWGDSSRGGVGEPSDDGYAKIVANSDAFAALKADGRITAWGDSSSGADDEPSDDGYVSITATGTAFAALKSDGSITAWGTNVYGGEGEPSDDGYVSIVSSGFAFAALKSDGSITAWGDSDGGVGEPTDDGYTAISSTQGAFAALKADGSITVWGHRGFGGANEPSGSGYSFR